LIVNNNAEYSVVMRILPEDMDDLKAAKWLLENPGIAAKITDFLGMPIQKGFELLPRTWTAVIGAITRAILFVSVNAAVFTMDTVPKKESSNLWHKLAVAATGGVGGFFGLPALVIELPVSTTIMLRSIADIARSEGEHISSSESKMACIEVFALGGSSQGDDGSGTGYFAIRAALAKSVTKAAEYVAEKGITQEGAPALIRLIFQVADRFSIQVSEKAAAQALPAIGAIGGVLINTLFIDHFQNMAHGHFVVRRLERKYGVSAVRDAYGGI
jgi:hypothetical protein